MALQAPGDMCACRLWPVDPDMCCDAWPDPWPIPPEIPPEDYTPEQRRALKAQRLAGEMLRSRTAGLWGLCEDLVRPCGTSHCRPRSGRGGVGPYVSGGKMFNRMCRCSCSDCGIGCTIILPGPVHSITSVTIDGREMSGRTSLMRTTWANVMANVSSWKELMEREPTWAPQDQGEEWFLDSRGGLSRLEGCWPHDQDMRVGCGEVGSFCVKYVRGIDPESSLEAIRAVSELACSYYQSFCGGTCRSLVGAKRVSRGGVTYEIPAGAFGIPSVDEWLAQVNPGGYRRPAQVRSLDLPRWTYRGASECHRSAS